MNTSDSEAAKTNTTMTAQSATCACQHNIVIKDNNGSINNKRALSLDRNVKVLNPGDARGQSGRIFLNKNKSAWVEVDCLPDDLARFAEEHFASMFALHPEEKGTVVMFGKNAPSQRWHQSYLNTPKYDETRQRSYMYSALAPKIESTRPLPKEFQPFLDHLNAIEEAAGRSKFNQAIANWYLDGNNFIASHSDCTFNMEPSAPIIVLSFQGSLPLSDGTTQQSRVFRIKPHRKRCADFEFDSLDIETTHGSQITMGGDMQSKFRHHVPKSFGDCASRISLTFRKMMPV